MLLCSIIGITAYLCITEYFYNSIAGYIFIALPIIMGFIAFIDFIRIELLTSEKDFNDKYNS